MMGRASVNSVNRAWFEMRETGEVIIDSREVYELFKQELHEIGIFFNVQVITNNKTNKEAFLCWMVGSDENEDEVYNVHEDEELDDDR